MNKIFFWLSMTTIGIAIFLLGLIFYWQFYTYDIIEYYTPFEVLNENNQVKRGEPLVFVASFNKKLAINGHASAEIICDDGNLVTVVPPKDAGAFFPLGEHKITIDAKIPYKTSIGTCRYVAYIDYEVNPIRHVLVEVYTEDFEVIE